jgi:hypothetical protein
LHHKLSPHKKSAKTSKGKKSKASIYIDFSKDPDASNNSDSNTSVATEDEDGEDGLTGEEKLAGRLLTAEFSRCALCGKDKLCKIDKNGNHAQLTNQQFRSWSAALVCHLSLCLFISNRFQASKMQGVTSTVPPKTAHFSAFHHEVLETTPLRAPVIGPTTPTTPTPIPDMATMMMSMMAGARLLHSQNPTLVSPAEQGRMVNDMPSSDPPEVSAFPTVKEWVEHLMAKREDRKDGLTRFLQACMEEEFLDVDQLKDYGANELIAEFKVKKGLALYLVDEIKRMKKVVKSNKPWYM